MCRRHLCFLSNPFFTECPLAFSKLIVSGINYPDDHYHNYGYTNRDTVMALLALMDPHGTRQRKQRRIERRVYRSMVSNNYC